VATNTFRLAAPSGAARRFRRAAPWRDCRDGAATMLLGTNAAPTNAAPRVSTIRRRCLDRTPAWCDAPRTSRRQSVVNLRPYLARHHGFRAGDGGNLQRPNRGCENGRLSTMVQGTSCAPVKKLRDFFDRLSALRQSNARQTRCPSIPAGPFSSDKARDARPALVVAPRWA